MDELVQQQSLDLGDYIAAIKRRIVMVILIAITVFISGVIIASVLPAVYESSSTILIEQQEIPLDLVRTTITTFASQTIQTINQRVMTRSNLMEIVEKFDLFKEEFKTIPTEIILDEMRENIMIDMITAQVMNPRTGAPGVATIAFKVGFKGEHPELVQKVANELTTLYLSENLRTRTEKTKETYDFLTLEANRLNDEITSMDATLSDFKTKNKDHLPETKNLVKQMLQQAQNSIEQIDLQNQSSKEAKTYLEGQLALLNPHAPSDEQGVFSPEGRLQALQMQYASLSAKYSPDHPDIVTLKREISVLKKNLGITSTVDDQFTQMDLLMKELARVKETYTDDHPDVKALKSQIARLDKSIGSVKDPDTVQIATPNPTNPAYITLKTQLEQSAIRNKLIFARRQELLKKVDDYEERLLRMPEIEGKYRAMNREYSTAVNEYQTISAKQRTAEIALELEKERKGEKFTLIEPAIYPSEPISPNRPAIMILSLLLAVGSGIGSAVAAEGLNSAVRGGKGLTNLLHTAPLAIIPYLPNTAEIVKKKKKRKLVFVLLIIIIFSLPLMVHFLHTPLDVLWYKSIRKAGLSTEE